MSTVPPRLLTGSTNPAGALIAAKPGTSWPVGPALAVGFALVMIIASALVLGPAVALVTVAPFVIAILLLALCNPNLAICAYFGYAAVEGMYKYLSGFSQVIYAIKPLLAAALLLFWFVAVRLREQKAKIPPLTLAVAIFVVWGIVAVFSPTGGSPVQGALVWLVWYAAPLGFYFLGFNVMRSTDQVKSLCYLLLAVCTVVSVFAVVQYVMGQSWTIAHLPGYDGITKHDWYTTDKHGNAVTESWSPASTTAYSGTASAWAHMGAILSLGLLLLPNTRPSVKVMLCLCLLVNIIGLLVIGVRLWVVALIFEAILLFLITPHSPRQLLNNIGLLFMLGGIATGGFFLAQSLSGGVIGGRYADTLANPAAKFQQDRGNNMTYLPLFLAEHPLGVGYQRGLDAGNTINGSYTVNRETQFNSVAADMGLPGLIFLLWLLGGGIVYGWRALRSLRPSGLKSLGATLFVLLLGEDAAAMGTPMLQGGDYFWLVTGVLLALPMIQASEARAARNENSAP